MRAGACERPRLFSMPWHGEHYYKWGKMAQEERMIMAGFELFTHKPADAPNRPISYYYYLICPEGQIYKYKHFGHALNRAIKIIKQKEEHRGKGVLSRTWETALERVDAYFRRELPQIDAWSLVSFHKYDYR